MGAADSTSLEADLKEYYADGGVKNVAYENAGTFFAMCRKKEDISGEAIHQPVQIGLAQGRSGSATTALANKTGNTYKKFIITMVEDFGSTSITRRVAKETRNNRGAFFDAVQREMDGIIQSLSRSASIQCQRNGGGARGQVHATTAISTVTLTLSNVEDAKNFDIGMKVVASDTDGTSGSVHSGTATIVGIDEDAGTLTASANWTTGIASIGASDYLFAEGDFGTMIKGLPAWIPPTAPGGGDNHFGVDRSVHVTMLAGSRVSASTLPIAQAIRKLSSKLGGRGGTQAKHWFSSHEKYNDLVLELGSKQEFMVQGKAFDAEVFFAGIKVHGAGGVIECYPDHTCLPQYGYLLNMKHIYLGSMGSVPDVFDDDGNTLMRDPLGWSTEYRVDYLANLVFEDTRDQGIADLGT